MRDRRTTLSLTTACLVLSLILTACGSADADDSRAGAESGTPTAAAASPTGEPIVTPSPMPQSTSIAELTTLDWQLAEIDGVPMLDGSIVTMNLVQRDDNLITGYGDCHFYLAGIVWDETAFRISDSGPFSGIDQSERTCQNPADGPRYDRYFFAALAEVVSYQASDERLVLSNDDGEPQLTFVPRPPVAVDPALTGTTWRAIGDAWLPGTEITLTFDGASVNGSDGCNEYGAQLLVASDGRLIFGNGSETDMACQAPEGVMEQADRFAEALTHVTSYRVDGDQLQFWSSNWGAPMVFMREGAEAFDPALAAQRWGLIGANGQPAVPGSLVTMEMSEGYVTGSDSCNGFAGVMPLANGGALKVDFAGFARTAQGCPTPEILAQAELVLAVLEDATWYTLDNDQLTIGDAAGNEIVFGPQADVLLIGTSWNVPMLYTELPGGEIRGDALVEGTDITLTFDEGGIVRGSAGCNTYQGSYTLDGASITIDLLFITAMACPDPPDVMEQETKYLDTLLAVTTWEIGMNGLTLTTDDGRALRELNVVSQ